MRDNLIVNKEEKVNISVLVEPIEKQGFRATGSQPFAMTADGVTEEEALLRLRALLTERFCNGGRIVSLNVAEITEEEHPWKPFAGIFAQEPLFDEWQEAIREYRRLIDEAP